MVVCILVYKKKKFTHIKKKKKKCTHKQDISVQDSFPPFRGVDGNEIVGATGSQPHLQGRRDDLVRWTASPQALLYLVRMKGQAFGGTNLLSHKSIMVANIIDHFFGIEVVDTYGLLC